MSEEICSKCGGTGEILAIMEDGSEDYVGCPFCQHSDSYMQGAEAFKEMLNKASPIWMQLYIEGVYAVFREKHQQEANEMAGVKHE